MSAPLRSVPQNVDTTQRDSQAVDLPPFDKAPRTKVLVVLCLYISGVCILLCWAIGAYIMATGHGHLVFRVSLSESQLEALAFLFTLLITFCSDTLGYVHATSLRWALYREGRLIYNTNLRLFTSAKTSLPNRWYMNALSALCLALCYACIAALVVRENYMYTKVDDMAINGLALLILGVGLLGLAMSAVLCIYHGTSQIPTWSSNPFTNTLAYLHEHKSLQRDHQPCTMGEEGGEADLPDPQSHKRPLWQFRSVKWIVLFIWALCILCFIWAGIVIAIPMAMYSHHELVFRWTKDEDQRVMFGMDPVTNSPRTRVSFPLGVQFFLAILFLCFVQGLQVLGLHCIELFVNRTRDEMVWRHSGRENGAALACEPLLSAYTSWRVIILTALKSGIHWLVSQCLIPMYHVPSRPAPQDYPEFIFSMSPSRLLILGAAVGVAAAYATALAFWPMRGRQPTVWGNMEVLANLVQDWHSSDGRIRWKE